MFRTTQSGGLNRVRQAAWQHVPHVHAAAAGREAAQSVATRLRGRHPGGLGGETRHILKFKIWCVSGGA